MEAKELRIGNIVWCHGTDEPRTHINKIDSTDIQLMDTKEGYLELHEPIPITGEWLMKFGFQPFEKGYSKEAFSPGHPSQRFDIDWNEESGTMCKSRYQPDADHFFMRHIKHVHQLQNLYFSLTGNELELLEIHPQSPWPDSSEDG